VLANYNKTRINIDYQHASRMELKGGWEFKFMLKCIHRCDRNLCSRWFSWK
jgi:hypothetical protein